MLKHGTKRKILAKSALTLRMLGLAGRDRSLFAHPL
jgi:hypothetical protein